MSIELVIRLIIILSFMTITIWFIIEKVKFHLDLYYQSNRELNKGLFHVSKQNKLEYLHIILPFYFKAKRINSELVKQENKILSTLLKLYLLIFVFILIGSIDSTI